VKVLELEFIKVNVNDMEAISIIYDILKTSGDYLYQSKGLIHWKNPYPKETIQENIKNREVFIVKDSITNQYIHTFQLEIKNSIIENNMDTESVVEINKFATHPNWLGQGVGKMSINYIEEHCKQKSINKITLEVYDKSEDAICFYKKVGFRTVGERKTRFFVVLIMEKYLNRK
jgi:ribosomal protein S18 acetylase RimI-like enzyme